MEREHVGDLARTLGDIDVGGTIRPATMAGRAAIVLGTSLPRLAVAGAGEKTAPADFELVEVLGKGGMGVVWLARQRSLHRSIAIKKLADGCGENEAAALLAEGRTTGVLEHPSIVPVHALGIDARGAPLLVMKRIEGASLTTLLADRAHPAWADLEQRYGGRTEACIEILMRIADALHFAHQRGFVHRDVKPDNIMVGSFGEIYLLDWGIALPRGARREDPLDLVGTPGYMAPEMLEASPEAIDARTDVYLLGATLHTVLTGRPRHDAPTLEAALYSVLDSFPFVYSNVPSELAEIANRATSRDRDTRFPSALALRDALGGFLRHRASMRLTERAADSLAALGESPTPEELASVSAARALAEARFGLTQALREWEGNEAARALLRRTLLALAEAEIQHKSPDSAALVASEIEPPDPGLEERIAALRASIEESERLAEGARKEAIERDPTLGGGARAFLSALLIAMVIIIGVVAVRTGPSSGTPVSMLLADLFFFGAFASLVIVLRRRLLVNRWGRQLVACMLAAAACGVFVHFVAWLKGDPPETSGPYFFVTSAAIFSIGTVMLTRRFAWVVATSTIGGIGSALYPALMPIATFVNFLAATGIIIIESLARRSDR